MGKDYYKTLGLEKSATEDEIKKAFRKLAHEYHPDKKTGNEAKFKEVNEAYQTLSDKKKRADYDRFGSAGTGPAAGGYTGGFGGFDSSGFEGFDFGNVGDIFSDFFGAGFGGGGGAHKKGSDIQIQISITLREAVFGTEKSVLVTKTNFCKVCSGTGGSPNSKQETCNKCKGQGRVQEARRSVFGTVNTVVQCNICQGTGKTYSERCNSCKGSCIKAEQTEIKIKVPAGIDNGQTLRMHGYGEAIANGTQGDLYIYIQVEKDKLFTRKGFDLYADKKIKLTEAMLGRTFTLETFDGNIDFDVPTGTNNGDEIRLRGKGVANRSGHRGDIVVRIKIETTKKLNANSKKLLEELQKEGL